MKKGYLITAAVGVSIVALSVLGYLQREKFKKTIKDLKKSFESYDDLDDE